MNRLDWSSYARHSAQQQTGDPQRNLREKEEQWAKILKSTKAKHQQALEQQKAEALNTLDALHTQLQAVPILTDEIYVLRQALETCEKEHAAKLEKVVVEAARDSESQASAQQRAAQVAVAGISASRTIRRLHVEAAFLHWRGRSDRDFEVDKRLRAQRQEHAREMMAAEVQLRSYAGEVSMMRKDNAQVPKLQNRVNDLEAAIAGWMQRADRAESESARAQVAAERGRKEIAQLKKRLQVVEGELQIADESTAARLNRVQVSRNRSIIRHLLNHATHGVLMMAWQQWHRMHKQTRALCKVAQCVRRMAHAASGRSWGKWREAVRQSREAESESELGALRKALDLERRQAKLELENAVSQSRRKCKTEAAAALKKAVEAAVAEAVQTTREECERTAAEAQKLMSLQGEEQLQRLHTARSRSVVQHWRNKVVHGALLVAWQTWRRTVWRMRREGRAGQTMVRCVGRIVHFSLGQGWGRWCEAVRQFQAELRAAKRCISRIVHLSLGQSWGKWREVVQQHQAECRAAKTMVRCVGRIMHAASGRSWGKWREAVRQSRDARSESELSALRKALDLERRQAAEQAAELRRLAREVEVTQESYERLRLAAVQRQREWQARLRAQCRAGAATAVAHAARTWEKVLTVRSFGRWQSHVFVDEDQVLLGYQQAMTDRSQWEARAEESRDARLLNQSQASASGSWSAFASDIVDIGQCI